MNKTQVETMLGNNITELEKCHAVLLSAKEQAETVKHYQSITKRWFDKVALNFPKVSYTREHDGEIVEYSRYYIREGYRYSNGKVDSIELSISENIENCTFNIDQSISDSNSSGRFEHIAYIGRNSEDNLTPQNILSWFDVAINNSNKEIEQLKRELSNINQIVNTHNETVQNMLDTIEEQNEVSYTLKSCMPKLDIPRVSEMYDFIRE